MNFLLRWPIFKGLWLVSGRVSFQPFIFQKSTSLRHPNHTSLQVLRQGRSSSWHSRWFTTTQGHLSLPNPAAKVTDLGENLSVGSFRFSLFGGWGSKQKHPLKKGHVLSSWTCLVFKSWVCVLGYVEENVSTIWFQLIEIQEVWPC